MTRNTRVVGIIGAGPAGLCAARHVTKREGWKAIVWEQTQHIGGTWRLSDRAGKDQHGLPVHSSIYNSLRTDLPAVLMGFPDYKFPEGESFMHHTVVLKYLEDYANHFDLLQHIKIGHRVEEVSPVTEPDGDEKWVVTVKDHITSHISKTICDALLVCNGHFSEPSVPSIEDLDKFSGHILHSHDYREPSPFIGGCVVVLGAGASALDISLELTESADKVFLSHNLPLKFPSELPPNLHQVASVVKAKERGFVFSDGMYRDADAIIYCTGYKYSFPFLSEACGVWVENNHVRELHEHIVNVRHPTMGFIGLPSRVIVFPLINYQVQYFLAVLEGQVTLPSLEEMLSIIRKSEQEHQEQGLPEKHYHTFAMSQFEYMRHLAVETGLEGPPSFMPQLFRTVLLRLFFSYPIFKTYTYSLGEDGTILESFGGHRVATGRDLARLVVIQTMRLLWRDFPRVFQLLASLLWHRFKKLFGFKR